MVKSLIINTAPTPAMVSGMRTGYAGGLNQGLGSKFRDGSRLRQEGSRLRQEGSRLRQEGSRVRQEIPEEDRKAYRPKRCTDINEDEDNSPNNTDNTNHQASSQTFR